MWHFDTGLLITLGAFVMVIILAAIKAMQKMRERELQAHQDLRAREMEHERRLKELEVEKARLELEKARTVKTGDAAPR